MKCGLSFFLPIKFVALAIAVPMIAISPAHAGDCDDLEEAIGGLSLVELGITLTDEVDEKLDKEIREFTVDMVEVADDIDDRKLRKYAERMRRAYNDKDLEDYEEALSKLTNRFEKIERKLC